MISILDSLYNPLGIILAKIYLTAQTNRSTQTIVSVELFLHKTFVKLLFLLLKKRHGYLHEKQD